MPPRPDFCYYEALEVTKTATQDEIKSSFRQLAMQRHPDKNPGDPNATANFQKVSSSLGILAEMPKLCLLFIKLILFVHRFQLPMKRYLTLQSEKDMIT